MSIYQYANESYLRRTLKLIDQLGHWNNKSKAPLCLKLKYLDYLRETRNKINNIARIASKDAPIWDTAISVMAVELTTQKRCIEHEDLNRN